ncbi:hypothetical protein GNI_019690 [Gregarina niphandrodes]|uniref:Uncharacterized protein n=1 Tax=Gregarina niphandrodes TaxID=110365 RepID=A0A023BC26_GRENI|nr:hypothetical protein GNI_019690 [Gregarina niphandrodes]EZG81193.1 hypothetical protein GNI_019690 [Gregarina niphandrodes]|eukprot:XP_011134251.1 hypothetical protein GNI_019690 [Gregarina niphandrodes]
MRAQQGVLIFAAADAVLKTGSPDELLVKGMVGNMIGRIVTSAGGTLLSDPLLDYQSVPSGVSDFVNTMGPLARSVNTIALGVDPLTALENGYSPTVRTLPLSMLVSPIDSAGNAIGDETATAVNPLAAGSTVLTGSDVLPRGGALVTREGRFSLYPTTREGRFRIGPNGERIIYGPGGADLVIDPDGNRQLLGPGGIPRFVNPIGDITDDAVAQVAASGFVLPYNREAVAQTLIPRIRLRSPRSTINFYQATDGANYTPFNRGIEGLTLPKAAKKLFPTISSYVP